MYYIICYYLINYYICIGMLPLCYVHVNFNYLNLYVSIIRYSHACSMHANDSTMTD